MFIKPYCSVFSKWCSILSIHVTEIHRMNSIPPVCFHHSTNLVYYIILLCYCPTVFYAEMTYRPTCTNSLVLCVHDNCLYLVKTRNYVIIMYFITLHNFFIFKIIFLIYREMYRCSHLYCVSTPEVLLHLLCINLQDNNICFAKGGPGEIPLDHFLTYYLFFLSLETISDRICLSFNMGVLIRHPLMFTRQGLFYYTVENCLKFDVKKGVCTQFIILSENFIRIIIISYKYIIYLNLHIHVYLSLIVGTGINKLVWSFVSCSIIGLYSRVLYITVSMMNMLSKSRTLVIYPQILWSFCMITVYTFHRQQYFFRVLEDG